MENVWKQNKHLNKNIHNNNHSNIPMKIHKEIEEIVKKERVVTSSEIAEKFKISWNTAEKYLLEMVIENRIIKIKKMGVNLWILK
jgi:ribosomal protein S25